MHGLVLGYGERLLDACNRLGIEATCVVPQRFWHYRDKIPGVNVLPVVSYDVEEVIGAITRAGIDPSAFTFALAAEEFSMTSAAVLGAAFGLACMPLRVALAARDKVVQKRLIRAAGLPCADTLTFEADQAVWPTEEQSASLLPGVLKPVFGAGARGAVVVRDRHELRDALKQASSAPPEAYVLESYVDGDELHLDGVVVGGRLWFLSVSRYRVKPIEVREGRSVSSITLDPSRHADLYRRACDFAAASTAALGLRDGIFHLEVFARGDELVFGELAARVGGVFIVEAVAAKFGVDLQEMRLRAELGLPFPDQAEPDSRDVGWTLLNLPPGRVLRVPTADELQGRPGVLRGTIDIAEGEEVGDLTSSSTSRAAMALLAGDDEEQLGRRMDELQEWLRKSSLVTANTRYAAEALGGELS